MDLPGVRITRAHELIKSPSEMNKVGRAVKGSASYLYSNLIIKGSRTSFMRSHVFIPFQGSETDLILNGKKYENRDYKSAERL